MQHLLLRCIDIFLNQIGGAMIMKNLFVLALVEVMLIAMSGCNQNSTPEKKPYTGVMRLKDGTEIAALERPSKIGGACKGWNTVAIRGSGPSSDGVGITDLTCWKREGENIIFTGKSGDQKQSNPAWVFFD